MRTETSAGRPLVVELCGLPGAGKSTLAAALTAQLAPPGGPGCRVLDAPISAAVPRGRRLPRRLLLAAGAVVRQPRAAALDVSRLLGSGPASRRDVVAGLAQWWATNALVTGARAGRGEAASSVCLLEEGPVHTVWTLLLRTASGDPSSWWATVPDAARSDLVLVLEVSPVEAQRRLAARASRHSRTQSLPSEAQRAELERGALLLERVLASCPVPVLRLRTEAAGPTRGWSDPPRGGEHSPPGLTRPAPAHGSPLAGGASVAGLPLNRP
jgi:hypothetical protein